MVPGSRAWGFRVKSLLHTSQPKCLGSDHLLLVNKVTKPNLTANLTVRSSQTPLARSTYVSRDLPLGHMVVLPLAAGTSCDPYFCF